MSEASATRTLGRPEGSSGAKTRARLLQIAAKLFAKNGLAGVTMADVAGAAGLTAPSIYNHFSSKDELFVATVTDMYDNISRGFARAVEMEGSWEDRVVAVLEIATELYRDDAVLQRLGGVAQMEAGQAPTRFRAIIDAQQHVDDVFRDVVRSAVDAGELPGDVNVHVAGDLLAGVLMLAIARLTDKRTSHAEFREIIDTFKRLFLHSA